MTISKGLDSFQGHGFEAIKRLSCCNPSKLDTDAKVVTELKKPIVTEFKVDIDPDDPKV